MSVVIDTDRAPKPRTLGKRNWVKCHSCGHVGLADKLKAGQPDPAHYRCRKCGAADLERIGLRGGLDFEREKHEG